VGGLRKLCSQHPCEVSKGTSAQQAVGEYTTLHTMAEPGREQPSILGYAKAVIIQAATSHLECSLVTSLKMGSGLKKTQFLSNAVMLFRDRVQQTSPTDVVHPLLAPLIKQASVVVAAASSSKKK
jgi:hypothetical protein